jgi:nitrite reductase/ring-hydroxylating ferredoxin subunit
MTGDAQAPAPPQRFVVARADELADGERLIADVGGRKIGIFRVGDQYHAILYLCPHSGGPLCEGPVVEHVWADLPGEIHHDPAHKFVACPWHGWIFDLKTGQSWSDPLRTRARQFPVAVQRGDEIRQGLDEQAERGPGAWRPGPYVVEKFPVLVEDDYIVVTMRPRSERAPTDAAL